MNNQRILIFLRAVVASFLFQFATMGFGLVPGSWRASKAESLTLQFSMPLGKQIECRARRGALRRFAR